MILGVSTNCFQGLNLGECVDVLFNLKDAVDFEAIELRLEKDDRNPSVWVNSFNSELKDSLGSFKIIGAHLPLNHIDLISKNPYDKHRSINTVIKGMEIAEMLNANYCVLHARGSKRWDLSNQMINEWMEIISELTQYAETKSLPLLLENADNLTNLQTLTKIVKSIDSKTLKIALDIGHAHIRQIGAAAGLIPRIEGFALRGVDFLTGNLHRSNRSMPYEEYGSISNFIRVESHLIGCVHVHDYNGRVDHLPLGSGSIDYYPLSVLNQIYEGPCILETISKAPYSDLVKSYSKLMECIR